MQGNNKKCIQKLLQKYALNTCKVINKEETEKLLYRY